MAPVLKGNAVFGVCASLLIMKFLFFTIWSISTVYLAATFGLSMVNTRLALYPPVPESLTLVDPIHTYLRSTTTNLWCMMSLERTVFLDLRTATVSRCRGSEALCRT